MTTEQQRQAASAPAWTLILPCAAPLPTPPQLPQQCEKLRHAHESGIACPAVYRADESDGLFSFDMEFVPGDSLAHILISGRLPDWDVLLPQITALIECYCGTGDGEIPASQFITKLDSIFHGCIANRAVQSELCGIEAALMALVTDANSGIPEGLYNGRSDVAMTEDRDGHHLGISTTSLDGHNS